MSWRPWRRRPRRHDCEWCHRVTVEIIAGDPGQPYGLVGPIGLHELATICRYSGGETDTPLPAGAVLRLYEVGGDERPY